MSRSGGSLCRAMSTSIFTDAYGSSTAFATEICHRDLEESGQLLGVAGQATDAAVRVVQDRQLSPARRLASAEAAEQCPRAQSLGGNSAADVAHDDCLTELEA